ncbi:MAG: hypothetical protein HQL38_13220 [Alphaproteobacteria bacterium]|nr:hypothetical protein [Alphaproteobacteria bacterium]MBF0374070.1 hypothetical protein [Alphaproteobacteria bacterium]MBF0393632.1 hypothetical protein [Alphaproteobacteria bacterium]
MQYQVRLVKTKEGWLVFDPAEPSVAVRCPPSAEDLERAIERVMERRLPRAA